LIKKKQIVTIFDIEENSDIFSKRID